MAYGIMPDTAPPQAAALPPHDMVHQSNERQGGSAFFFATQYASQMDKSSTALLGMKDKGPATAKPLASRLGPKGPQKKSQTHPLQFGAEDVSEDASSSAGIPALSGPQPPAENEVSVLVSKQPAQT